MPQGFWFDDTTTILCSLITIKIYIICIVLFEVLYKEGLVLELVIKLR